MRAIGYIRWSTLEQGNSDRSSEERQRLAVEAFARLNGWTLSETLTDSGRSAFTGANLTKGELGKLTKRLLSGAIDPTTTVLVVEELDRLSRRPPGEMTSWMMPLLMAGLTIGVANTGTILTADKVNNDFGSFVSLMSQAFSAYDFSRKQQLRGAASWEKRRKAFEVDGTALSRHRGRKWLEWNPVTKTFDPIPPRVAIIEEMFRLRLAGFGKGAIAKYLMQKAETDAAYAPWRSTSKAPMRWTESAVARIIQDPAVTGYIQFHRNPRGADKRTPIGVPVKVYPAVIDDETFARANEHRLTEQLRTQGRGRAISNLFGNIMRCKVCDGPMQPLGSSRFRINKDGSKSQHYFVYCLTAKGSKGTKCSNQNGWTYSKLEIPILDNLLPLALDDQYFRSNDDEINQLEGQVAIVRRRIQEQTRQSSNLLALVQEDDADEVAMDAYRAARDRLKASRVALSELAAKVAEASGKTSSKGHVIRVQDVRERMQSDDPDERYEARSTARLALRALIETIEFDPARAGVAVNLRHGLGLMIVRDDGAAPFWNLHKSHVSLEREKADDRAIIEGYRRRVAKDSGAA